MRDYDPTLGRYIQADPLGLVDGASVYGNARQSPNRYVDVTGQCPQCIAVVRGGRAAFGVGTALGNAIAGTTIGASAIGYIAQELYDRHQEKARQAMLDMALENGQCPLPDVVFNDKDEEVGISIGRKGGAADGSCKNAHKKRGRNSTTQKHTKKGAGTRSKSRNKKGFFQR